jgi:hypothetical protein
MRRWRSNIFTSCIANLPVSALSEHHSRGLRGLPEGSGHGSRASQGVGEGRSRTIIAGCHNGKRTPVRQVRQPVRSHQAIARRARARRRLCKVQP